MYCVIGIDGGGTRSTGLCVGLNGQLFAQAQGGALNYNGASVDRFREHLSQIVEALRGSVPGARVLRYVIGTASLFDYAAAADLRKACHNLLPESEACLLGDALVALYGATGGQPGALVISGTGSIAVSLDSDKRFRTSGGFGPLIGGDPGSAFWMAGQAVLAAAQASPTSALARAVRDYFGVEHLHNLIDLVYQRADGCSRLAGLSGALAGSDLAREDPFLRIQTEAGQALAAMTRPLLNDQPTVFVSGSVLRYNSIVRGALETALRLTGPVRLREPGLSAASGAALMALEQAGVPLNESILRALQSK